MKSYLLIIIWALAIISCQKKEVAIKKYFSVDSLIDHQVKFLIATGASVTKSAFIDNASDKSTFKPDEEGWRSELAVFRHLEIMNKPIYADSYEEIDGMEDDNSNLKVRVFNAKSNVPVKQLKIYYQTNPHVVRKIEAYLDEQNSLYYTSRRFSMEMDEFKDKLVLSQYEIQGVQKMILRDSVKFSISSVIKY